jgi:hypothetical protein
VIQGEEAVLIDTCRLLDFLSCSLTSDIAGPANRPAASSCDHQLMHPREARYHKLVPKPLFDRLVALAESEGLNRNVLGPCRQINVDDAYEYSIRCTECVQMYEIELALKLDLLEKYMGLFNDLVAASSSTNDEIFDQENEEYAYAVSKQFVKRYRRHVLDLMKKIGDPASVSAPSSLSGRAIYICEGIDAVDLSTIELNLDPAWHPSAMEKEKTSEPCSLEAHVNDSITCKFSTYIPVLRVFPSFYSSNFLRLISRPTREL